MVKRGFTPRLPFWFWVVLNLSRSLKPRCILACSLVVWLLQSCSVELMDESASHEPTALPPNPAEGSSISRAWQWAILPTEQPNRYLLELDPRLQVEWVKVTQRLGDNQVPRIFNGTRPIVLEGGFDYSAEFSGSTHKIDFGVPRDLVLQGEIHPKNPAPGRFDQASGRLEIFTEGRIFLSEGARVSAGQSILILRGHSLIGQGGLIRTFSYDAHAPPGQVGAPGGFIELQFEKASGLIHLELFGQGGGQGATGPPHAGPAPAGPNLNHIRVHDDRCRAVPPGSSGANGAQGNPGGQGFPGGSGGQLRFHVQDHSSARVLVRGGAGRGGPGGDGGQGQPGGPGGLGVQTYTLVCYRPRPFPTLVGLLSDPKGRVKFESPSGLLAKLWFRSGDQLQTQLAYEDCEERNCKNTPARGPAGATGSQGPRGPSGQAGADPGQLCYRGENQCQPLPPQYQQGHWVEFRWP